MFVKYLTFDNSKIKLIYSPIRSYATSNTILTMGMDFYYRDAKKWFVNLEALMAEVKISKKKIPALKKNISSFIISPNNFPFQFVFFLI